MATRHIPPGCTEVIEEVVVAASCCPSNIDQHGLRSPGRRAVILLHSLTILWAGHRDTHHAHTVQSPLATTIVAMPSLSPIYSRVEFLNLDIDTAINDKYTISGAFAWSIDTVVLKCESSSGRFLAVKAAI